MLSYCCLIVAHLDDDNARLPVGFVPEGPGHYQCRVILRAPNDVRVYHIEVTVNPEGSDIELEFTSPTHESVTQNIPVVNGSERDWTLYAKIDGEGFYGPAELHCPRQTSRSYALTYQPMYEGIVKVCDFKVVIFLLKSFYCGTL